MFLEERYGAEKFTMGFVSLLRSAGMNCRLIYNMQPPDITDIGRLPKEKVDKIDVILMAVSLFTFQYFGAKSGTSVQRNG